MTTIHRFIQPEQYVRSYFYLFYCVHVGNCYGIIQYTVYRYIYIYIYIYLIKLNQSQRCSRYIHHSSSSNSTTKPSMNQICCSAFSLLLPFLIFSPLPHRASHSGCCPGWGFLPWGVLVVVRHRLGTEASWIAKLLGALARLRLGPPALT